MLKLASENSVATSYEVKEQLLLPGSSSLILFLNLQPGDKTADIKGHMTPLLNMAGIMLFEISPVPRKISRDFTKSDNTLNTTAQIRVGTYGENGFEIEQITIPGLPLQKWICLGILREGRRIDVVYDNRIVASKRLNNNLPSQPYGGLTIANTKKIEKQRVIVNSKEEFDSLMAKILDDASKVKMPETDFSKNRLLVVTTGTNDTKGYTIKIKSIYKNEQQKKLDAVILLSKPGESCQNPEEANIAIDIVKLEKNNGDVTFDKEERTVECN